MKIAELLDENLFAKGLNAIKSIGSKASPTAAKASDDAVAALRADQDARLMAIARGTRAARLNPGDVVNVNLRAYRNQPQFAMGKDVRFPGRDTEIAKIIKIEPHPVAGTNQMMATVETIPRAAGSERVMYKGQQVGSKTGNPEPERIFIPVEFLSKGS